MAHPAMPGSADLGPGHGPLIAAGVGLRAAGEAVHRPSRNAPSRQGDAS